jgi:hypothetical protein
MAMLYIVIRQIGCLGFVGAENGVMLAFFTGRDTRRNGLLCAFRFITDLIYVVTQWPDHLDFNNFLERGKDLPYHKAGF